MKKMKLFYNLCLPIAELYDCWGQQDGTNLCMYVCMFVYVYVMCE